MCACVDFIPVGTTPLQHFIPNASRIVSDDNHKHAGAVTIQLPVNICRVWFVKRQSDIVILCILERIGLKDYPQTLKLFTIR